MLDDLSITCNTRNNKSNSGLTGACSSSYALIPGRDGVWPSKVECKLRTGILDTPIGCQCQKQHSRVVSNNGISPEKEISCAELVSFVSGIIGAYDVNVAPCLVKLAAHQNSSIFDNSLRVAKHQYSGI